METLLGQIDDVRKFMLAGFGARGQAGRQAGSETGHIYAGLNWEI